MLFPKNPKVRDLKLLKKYAKDYPACQVCGCQAADVHHIVFKSQGGGDVWENVISLCHMHHGVGQYGAHGVNSREIRETLQQIKESDTFSKEIFEYK